MPRYRRIRKYRKKGRWSANIVDITNTFSVEAGPANFFKSITLCQNPTQSSSTISQQYTVKNIELQYYIQSVNASNLMNMSVYVMYAPQGINIGYDYVSQHPEYIMAYKFLGNADAQDNNSDRNALSIRTRLSRRLQTGDGIILFIKGYNGASSSTNASLTGIVRWWTKAN